MTGIYINKQSYVIIIHGLNKARQVKKLHIILYILLRFTLYYLRELSYSSSIFIK